MTIPRPLLLALCFCLGAGTLTTARGQGGSRLTTPPTADRKKALQDAEQKLRERLDVEKARGTAKGLLDKLPAGVTDAARSAFENPETKAKAIEAAKAAAERLINENPKAAEAAAAAGMTPQIPGGVAPVQALPVPATPGSKVAETPPGPVPQALQPLADPNSVLDASGRTPMVTILSDKFDFDQNNAVMIYSGNVKARHPDFYISCEQLEVYLDKEATSGTKKKSTPVKASNSSKSAPDDSRIKKAIATGPTVSIEKRSEEGDIQQGRCQRMTYDGTTGKIVLSSKPQVQRGQYLQIATDPSTIMTFDRNGKMNTEGPSRTIILSGDQPPGADGAPAPQGGARPGLGN